jgi:hypothetical protein
VRFELTVNVYGILGPKILCYGQGTVAFDFLRIGGYLAILLAVDLPPIRPQQFLYGFIKKYQ